MILHLFVIPPLCYAIYEYVYIPTKSIPPKICSEISSHHHQNDDITKIKRNENNNYIQ